MLLHFRHPRTHCPGHGCYSTTDSACQLLRQHPRLPRDPQTVQPRLVLSLRSYKRLLRGTASIGWPWSVNGAALYQLSWCQKRVKPGGEEGTMLQRTSVRPMCQRDTRHTVKLYRLPGSEGKATRSALRFHTAVSQGQAHLYYTRHLQWTARGAHGTFSRR